MSRFIRSGLLCAAVVASVTACASSPNRGPVGVTSLPSVIQVRDWPYWIDIPVEESNPERMWRTTVDVISDRAAMAVLDRESGYLRTEWKNVDIRYGDALSEERYTVRLRPQEGKIRLGLEVRLRGTNTYPNTIINTIQAPWTAVYKELQARMATMR